MACAVSWPLQGPGTDFRTLQLEPEGTPQAPGQSGYQWRDLATSTFPISDDEGTGNVTQNSQNYAFYQPLLTSQYDALNGFAGPAQFDVVIQALDGTQLIARNHVVVNVGSPAP